MVWGRNDRGNVLGGEWSGVVGGGEKWPGECERGKMPKGNAGGNWPGVKDPGEVLTLCRPMGIPPEQSILLHGKNNSK